MLMFLFCRSNPSPEAISDQSILAEKATCSIDEAFLNEVIDAIIQDPKIGNEK